jgi:hypothetical protein
MGRERIRAKNWRVNLLSTFHLERQKRIWQANIKMNLTEIG